MEGSLVLRLVSYFVLYYSFRDAVTNAMRRNWTVIHLTCVSTNKNCARRVRRATMRPRYGDECWSYLGVDTVRSS